MFLMSNRQTRLRQIAEDILGHFPQNNGVRRIVLHYQDKKELIDFSRAITALTDTLDQRTHLPIVVNAFRFDWTVGDYPIELRYFFKQYHVGRERIK